MNLIWRFFWIIFISRFHSPLAHIFAKCRTKFRVWPTDIDLLMHMNNGRYLSMMDLARINYMARLNFLNKLSAKQFYPVIAGEMIRFKQSILLFQTYAIETHLLGWDDNFFYIAQYFLIKNKLCALGIVKVAFLHKQAGRQHTSAILAALNVTEPSPTLPDWLSQWQHAEQDFYQNSKTLNFDQN